MLISRWTPGVTFLLFVVPLLHLSPIADAKELEIENTKLFTQLDGSADDEDGLADGVLTVRGLEIEDGGRLVLDLPQCSIEVGGDMRLESNGEIAPADSLPFDTGPRLVINAAKDVVLTGNSRISVDGARFGGELRICAGHLVELRGDASATAKAGSGSVDGVGGLVVIEAAGKLLLNSSASKISASGPAGGQVMLTSCSEDAGAVLLKGRVYANGTLGSGGTIDVTARQGGILIFGSAELTATGATTDGEILLHAATTVTPATPPADPPAMVVTGNPSNEPCGPCTFSTPDDCDGNGTPDIQDLINCLGDPSCDDCNLNGVLDGCDIASGDSADVNPGDAIPDECSDFAQSGCSPPSDAWSCFDNWTLGGDLYPDDLASAPGVYVTLGTGDSTFLDVDAQIPTLRLLAGALLRLPQAGPLGDLAFSSPAVLHNQGTILIANDRVLGGSAGLAPIVILGPNGSYQKDPAAATPSTSMLGAQTLTLQAGSCSGGQSNGAIIKLSDAMQLSILGDMLVDGATVAECDSDGTAAVRGGVTPPPKVTAQDSAEIDVGVRETDRGQTAAGSGEGVAAELGTLRLTNNVQIEILGSATVRVRGDFLNESTAPQLFHWIGGQLVLDGLTSQVEVAGQDVGATLAGFGTASNTNFSIGTVHVSARTTAIFANRFANSVGSAACEEALYVRHLILEAGAQVTLDNCRIYSRALSNAGFPPTLLGCSSLVQLPPPVSPDAGDDRCFVSVTDLQSPCTTDGDCTAPAVCGLKSRYLTFKPSESVIAGTDEALSIKVQISSLPSSPDRVGEVWWAGPTQPLTNGPHAPLWASPLQCVAHPHSEVWPNGDLQLFGAAIIPGASYEVSMCDDTGSVCSAPLTIASGRWADVVAPFDQVGQPSFFDIVAIVDAFRVTPFAIETSRADLAGPTIIDGSNTPNGVVNMVDVSMAIDAYRGLAYPFTVPACQP